MEEVSAGSQYGVITFSLVIAMILTVLPLPTWAIWARPQWVFMVLLFWVMVLPSRVGVGLAFSLGLVMDLLTGVTLGQHALVYTGVSYLIIKFHPQLRNFPMWQQMLMVLILVMLNLALQYCVMASLKIAPSTWEFWWPAITTMILWPWVSVLLRDSQS